MRSFDRKVAELLHDPDRLKRVRPFLSELFDPVTLERSTFLAELGLETGDDTLLRIGVLGQSWLPSAIFYRALAEELRHRQEDFDTLIHDFSALEEREQWQVSQRVFARMEQLVMVSKDRQRVAEELGVSVADLDGWRKRWKESMGRDDQMLSQAIQLRLLGVGLPGEELKQRVEAQSTRPFLFFFKLARPILTKVEDQAVELIVSVPSPLGNGKEYVVRESLQKEIEENRHLGPQLWGKQWVDYLNSHKGLSNAEMRLLLDHLEEGGRHRWPDMVAAGGARARRAVSAVAVGLLEAIANADDPEAIQRLFTLIENFSEHHEMKAVLKKRFGI